MNMKENDIQSAKNRKDMFSNNRGPTKGKIIIVITNLYNNEKRCTFRFGLVWFMMFNATFNNISAILWQSVLLVEETGENHRPVASH